MSEIPKDAMPRKIKPNRMSETQIATNNIRGMGRKEEEKD